MADFDYELVTISDGVRVAVPRSLHLITTYVLKEQLDWFEDETHFVRRLARPGLNAVDVGANYGAYALALGRRVAPSGEVWAFEPAHATAEHLRASVAANALANVHVVEAALSNREGSATLHAGASSELNTLNPAPGGGTAGGGEAVALRTLDACAREHRIGGVAFLKLDAEGEEARILEGAREFLAANDPLCMFELKHGRALNAPLVEAFRALGYAIYRLVPGPNVLAPWAGGADPFQLNLFACSAARAEICAAAGLLALAVPDEAALPGADAGAWAALAAGWPYANALAAPWGDSAGAPAPGREQVEAALARYAQSRDEAGLSAAARCGALAASFDRLSAALDRSARTSRLLSVARVAAEAGRRAIAVQALDSILAALDAGRPLELDEPFLSPNPRFDAIDPRGDVEKWCLAAVVEQLELLSHYSSFYTMEASLPRLTFFQELGFPGPQMQRRLELVRARLASGR